LIDEVNEMAKKTLTFSYDDAKVILEHISEKSHKVSGEKIPPYAMGYLMSMLDRLAISSSAARRELLSDVEYIKGL
jgi:hypothetical protein